MGTILLIDDDRRLTELLDAYLKRFGFTVHVANHPDEGLAVFKKEKLDLIVLDLMLPDKDGFTVCKEIRKQSQIPLLILSARGEVTDKVVGLELGADDYLAKPFEPRELVARVQSILRRSRSAKTVTARKYLADTLAIDAQTRAVHLAGKEIALTTTEFELLLFFARHPGRVIGRDEIMDQIRGIDWEAFNRSIDVAVSRLRQKLGDDPKHPRFFKTIWGTGYLFIPSVREE